MRRNVKTLIGSYGEMKRTDDFGWLKRCATTNVERNVTERQVWLELKRTRNVLVCQVWNNCRRKIQGQPAMRVDHLEKTVKTVSVYVSRCLSVRACVYLHCLVVASTKLLDTLFVFYLDDLFFQIHVSKEISNLTISRAGCASWVPETVSNQRRPEMK